MSPREFPERPLVGLGAVVVSAEGVLLIKRSKPPSAGAWSLPGGAQKLGETAEQGILREVREETGLEVQTIGLIDVIDSIHRDADGRIRYHYTLVDMAAIVVGGTLEAGGDAADVRWFSKEQLKELTLWSETTRVIDLAFDLYQSLDRA